MSLTMSPAADWNAEGLSQPRCPGFPHPLPRRSSLRTPRKIGKARPALLKLLPQLLPTVPEESGGCRPRRKHQYQQGHRHFLPSKTAPIRLLCPALTPSMRINAESGQPSSNNYKDYQVPGVALTLLQSQGGKGRRGEGNEKKLTAVRRCVVVLWLFG